MFYLTSTLDLNFLLFLLLSRHVHLRSLLDRLFHNVYTLRNLQLVVKMQFDLIYNHPKAPFLKRLLDMHEHIAYIQYI